MAMDYERLPNHQRHSCTSNKIKMVTALETPKHERGTEPLNSDSSSLGKFNEEMNTSLKPFNTPSQSEISRLTGNALVPPIESTTSPAPYGNYTHEPRDEVDLNYYLPLYKAAKHGDWESAKRFIEHDPDALTAVISLHKMNALHVASCSGRWQFVEKLVELMPTEALAVGENLGRTALHFAAIGGTAKAAMTLVRKNRDLTQIEDIFRQTPLFQAASWARPELKEVVWYLSLVTRDEYPSIPFTGPSAASLILNITASGYYDICLYLIRCYPHLATVRDSTNTTILNVLCQNPSAFPSGSRLGFWKTCIYPFVPVNINYGQTPTHSKHSDMEYPFQNVRGPKEVPASMRSSFCLAQVPGIKQVYDVKWRHRHVLELVECICKNALPNMNNAQFIDFFVASNVMNHSASVGIVEIVVVCLQYFPDLIWTPMNKCNMMHVAVEHRQEKILNLLYKLYGMSATNSIMSSVLVDSYSSILHVVAKLAPFGQLNSVSGSAFQMQRELQWFKEVEKLVHPNIMAAKNFDGKTAREIFTKEHADLLEKGEKWMKDTSNSCMVVSTLIATVMFAAAFTVPGGNSEDKGIPVFLKSNSFMVFAISDAFALFSSTTSLLMFLSILTSRYAEEDFLKPLPQRLIIGLASLFFAIATMMIAFGATLSIVLSERLRWVSIPVTLLACAPVILFAMLQLPLFVQMVQSTYGPGIFRRQSDPNDLRLE